MTETLRKSLSALADQEATEFEARKILDAMKAKPELKSYYASCQALRSTLRGEPLLGASLLDRINAEIDGCADVQPILESAKAAPETHVTFLPAREALPNRFAALTGQLAVAASIAFAVVIGVKIVAPMDAQPVVAAQQEPLEFVQFQLPVQRETVSVDGMSSDAIDQNMRPIARILTEQDMKQMVSTRLGPYLIRHAENTAVVGDTSVLPLARIMGRDEPIQ